MQPDEQTKPHGLGIPNESYRKNDNGIPEDLGIKERRHQQKKTPKFCMTIRGSVMSFVNFTFPRTPED